MNRRGAVLQRILALDPEREHQEIVALICCYEFPFDITRSLEFALFRTYCVPRTSKLLDATGEFGRCPQKRYDDTDIIISEMMEWGYDSERGANALARMNEIHGRFKIGNEDFLYVLSAFVYEPIRWIARYGWRPITEHEQLALFHFWREVGRRMGMQNLPHDFDAFERFNREHEKKYFAFDRSNERIATATRELFASWFPRPLRPLVRLSIYALLDDMTRQAMGFPQAPRGLAALLNAVMRTRARLLRYLPPRNKPRLRTSMRHRSYPRGYRIAELGPNYASRKPSPESVRAG